MKRVLPLLLVFLLLAGTALAEVPLVGTQAAEEAIANSDLTTTGYVAFVYRNRVLREKKVTYYPDVWAFNHGQYALTHFAAAVPEEFFLRDATGHLAVAPSVLDICDAMRYALYGKDTGQVALLYGQYTEMVRSKDNKLGYSGIHEGIDFVSKEGQQLHAILPGEILRAGTDKDGTVAVYNEALDVTVLYLHCREVEVVRGDMVVAGQPLALEGDKGSGAPYVHIEVRNGKYRSPNPYRNATVESDVPYYLFATELGVEFSEGRETETYEQYVLAEQERLALEAEAARIAAEALAAEEAERLAAEEAAQQAAEELAQQEAAAEAARLEELRIQQEEAAAEAARLEELRRLQEQATPTPMPTSTESPAPTATGNGQ